MTKVFVTGITGKSGKYLLDEIVKNDNPEYSFTFLVRSETKAQSIKAKFPRAQFLLASLDDSTLLCSELNRGGTTYCSI